MALPVVISSVTFDPVSGNLLVAGTVGGGPTVNMQVNPSEVFYLQNAASIQLYLAMKLVVANGVAETFTALNGTVNL